MLNIAKHARKAAMNALCLAVLALSMGFSASQVHAVSAPKTLVIGGTGTALGGMSLLAEAFMKDHPEIKVTVLPSLGSGGGIKAAIAGKLGLAASARPLKDKEKAPGLKAFLYARTPIVFATHKGTAANNVDLEQLPKYYTGKNKTWPDGTFVRIVIRPETESDTKLLRGLSKAMDKALPIARERGVLYTAINDQDNASALEKVPGSLGLTTLAQILSENRNLKPLTFNGNSASVASLRAGEYPYFKELYLVTKEPLSAEATAFVAFMHSDAGKAILAANGHEVIEAGN